MWLLECEGPVLEGKRIWLRPGKRYLFGRTHSHGDGVGKGFKIDHSTISRKHATITVDLPLPGDVTNIAARSGLTIEDLKSKHGTHVGERKLSGESMSLYGDEQSFHLGGFEDNIRWSPVVFTFKHSTKDKDKKLLKQYRDLLEPLDIKAVDEFDASTTTHVVSNKRNTPQTLQALVYAKYVVDDRILKELEYVTTEGNLDEPESMSKLESDFDDGWPDPLKYLPPANREPNPKSEDYFAPDPNRSKVFDGYTFIFFDKKQYDGLQPAISGGGGHAKLHELKIGKATAADIIRIMKNEFEIAESAIDGSGYGVLHVRLVVSDPTFEEWATRIQTESITALGRGLVEQNEFLEAIVLNDARGLVKKAVSQAESLHSTSNAANNGSSRSVPNTLSADSRQQLGSETQLRTQSSVPQVGQNSSQVGQNTVTRPEDTPNQEQAATTLTSRNRRHRTRGPAVRVFAGFEDPEEDPEMPLIKEASPENTPHAQTQPAQPIDLEDSMILEEDPSTMTTPRKRPLPPDLEAGEDINAKLFPAQAAAKKRRLDNNEITQRSSTTTPEKTPSEREQKKSKANAEIKYEAKMRNIREKQEEIKDDELEPMHEQLGKMSFEERQNLVRIEEFDIKPRKRDDISNQTKDSRWDDSWNGRKNFKGFRRRGQPATTRSGPRIIIALEPIKTLSATEQYLATKQTDSERKRAKQREEDEEEESELSQSYADANSHLEEAPAELLGDGGSEIIDIDAPRATRASDRGSQAPSRTRTKASSLKRQASTTTSGPAKKSRKLNLKPIDDGSSEEDEIPKFRFKKK